jgi:hypothetical protein|tara:strand:+ start:1746 stop:2432 length:687 start_codon:yes stop_codon:yes gene_type:complete
MKKTLLFLFIVTSVYAEQKPYSQIYKRNAFALLDKSPSKVEIPPLLARPTIKLNLTGIIASRGVTNVYLFSKDIPKRYLTLSTEQRTDSGITLLSVAKGLVQINNNGITEMLSFDTHKLPSIITLPALKLTPTVIKKKDDKKSKDIKTTPTTLKPNIVKVPSRRGAITDPRMQKMMEKGLEYVSKIDDPKKREIMLERIEKFQRGEYDKDIKERMRKYEESKKSGGKR